MGIRAIWANHAPNALVEIDGARTRRHRRKCAPASNAASRASASAISGISSVGAKPSSAGARTAWASTGRPARWWSLASESARAVRSCACVVALRRRWRSGRLLPQGAGISGAKLQPNFAARPMQFWFERATAQAVRRRQRFVEDADGAVGIATWASASASAIFNSPSKIRDVLLFANSSPPRRHVHRSPLPITVLAAVAQPSRNAPNAPNMGRSCSRAKRTSRRAFGAARARSPRISSNKAACPSP